MNGSTCQLPLPVDQDLNINLEPILLTWFTSNPSMDK